jgi:hypothetical protein
LKTENFPLSLSLKNSKKPKTWLGTRWSAIRVCHAGCSFLVERERENLTQSDVENPTAGEFRCLSPFFAILCNVFAVSYTISSREFRLGSSPTSASPGTERRISLAAARDDKHLNAPLFVVVSFVLAFLILLLGFSLYFQYKNYSLGIGTALATPSRLDHSVVLAYARAWDFAVVKTSSIFLSFTMIFVGSLYVLRVAGTGFGLTIEGLATKGSLETSSPGLVMITLGVVLVIAVIYAKSLVSYNPPAVPISVQSDRPVDNGGLSTPKEGPTKEIRR